MTETGSVTLSNGEKRPLVINQVYEVVKSHPALTAAQIGEYVGLSRSTASNYLYKLRKRGSVIAYPDDSLRYNTKRWIDVELLNNAD